MRYPSAQPPRFALIDRDGTIIFDKVYLADLAEIEFAPSVIEGMQLLRDACVRLIIVTNQSGIGRGFFSEDTLANIHAALEDKLASHGIRLERIYHCPHAPSAKCRCRKPAPGMLQNAMSDFGFAARDAVMIGDSTVDMAAAAAVGMAGIRIGADAQPTSATHQFAPDFLTAASLAIRYFRSQDRQERPCL